MIPDPSGQLAELIVYITSTRVDLYSHQILFGTPEYVSGSFVFSISVLWIRSHPIAKCDPSYGRASQHDPQSCPFGDPALNK